MIDKIYFRKTLKSGEIQAVFNWEEKNYKLKVKEFDDNIEQFRCSARAKEIKAKIIEIASDVERRNLSIKTFRSMFSTYLTGNVYVKKGRRIYKSNRVSILFDDKDMIVRFYSGGKYSTIRTRSGISKAVYDSSEEAMFEVFKFSKIANNIADMNPTHEVFREKILKEIEKMPTFV